MKAHTSWFSYIWFWQEEDSCQAEDQGVKLQDKQIVSVSEAVDLEISQQIPSRISTSFQPKLVSTLVYLPTYLR